MPAEQEEVIFEVGPGGVFQTPLGSIRTKAAKISTQPRPGWSLLTMVLHAEVKSNDRPALVDHALGYHGLGWSVIPVANKRAIGLWKNFQTAPPDETTLLKLFTRKGITGLAAILGQASGMLGVRDFDRSEAYSRWRERHRALAKTLPTVRTGRGRHVYFHAPEETFKDLGDGEYRADRGHYCVLPPSIHESGRLYEWTRKPGQGLPEIDPVADELILPMVRNSSPKREAPNKAITHSSLHPTTHQHIACVPLSVTEAIEATLPTGPGQRNRRIFDLVRRLRGIPNLDTSPTFLRAIMTAWYEKALPVITTRDFGESWSDFQIAWGRLKVPLRATTVEAALAAARLEPAIVDGSAELGLLASFCKRLSAASNDGSFFLGTRIVAELFGIHKNAAWRQLQALQFHEIIQLVSKGSLKGHQASTWRYLGTNGP